MCSEECKLKAQAEYKTKSENETFRKVEESTEKLKNNVRKLTSDADEIVTAKIKKDYPQL